MADVGRLARRIARDLFTDGAGHLAGRLVFEYPNGQRIEGMGWSEKAFADRIAGTIWVSSEPGYIKR
jgi:hypothetical protein